MKPSSTQLLRHLVALAFVCGTPLAAPGCASTPDVEEAPLAESRRKKLRKTMIGTWEHIYRVTQDGARKPVDANVVEWTFRKDGSGSYVQTSNQEEAKTERKFNWELEGRNIAINYTGNKASAYYRAETWSPRQMRWYSYATEQIYVLRSRE